MHRANNLNKTFKYISPNIRGKIHLGSGKITSIYTLLLSIFPKALLQIAYKPFFENIHSYWHWLILIKYLFSYTVGGYREDATRIFLEANSGRMKGKGHNLQYGKHRIFFTVKVVQHWVVLSQMYSTLGSIVK